MRSENFFMSTFITFCIKEALIFKFRVIFDKVMRVYSQKIEKKTFQKSFFFFFFGLSQNIPFFEALTFKYLQNPLVKLKKWAHSEILSLMAFKWCKNQVILIKFQFWPTSSTIWTVNWFQKFEKRGTVFHLCHAFAIA